MTPDNKNPKPQFEDALAAVRKDEPGPEEIQSAGARVWARMTETAPAPAVEQIHGCEDVRKLLPAFSAGALPTARMLLVQDHIRECVACRTLSETGREKSFSWTAPAAGTAKRWTTPRFAMAAAALVVVVISGLLLQFWYFATPAGARATVQSVDGALYRVAGGTEQMVKPGDLLAESEVIRTGPDSHAFLRLRDGSVVEMSGRAEFSVAARRNDTTVNLDRGRIIVEAAKRRTGHLYVLTPDCRVAVTGTVFAVNAGMKGSRVSVVEGEVHVSFAGAKDVLHSGDQVATSASISAVPVRDEIAWSRNLDKHLALLAEFAKLQKSLDQVPMPGLRYTSSILDRVPSNIVFYGAVPNLGDTLTEANRVFQDQLQQSPVLREWWGKEHKGGDAAEIQQLVDRLHLIAQYVGDEVVIVSLPEQQGRSGGTVAIAEVKRQGLAEVLQNAFTNLGGHAGKKGIRVIAPAQLNGSPAGTSTDLLAVVRPDVVLVSSEVPALRLMNASLNSNSTGFANTDFGRRIGEAYRRGAGFLFAVNVENAKPRMYTNAGNRNGLQQTGFADTRFIIAEHRDVSGASDNRAVVEFAGERHGIASWLAAPAPIGSLDFVSANAGLAVAFVSKSPALMMDDIIQMASGDRERRDLQEAESKLNVNLREDLAAAFGGDVTWALDGPVLPSPSWKVVAQVNDPQRLQSALERIVQAANSEAQQHGRPGVGIDKETVNGQTFYAVRTPDRNGMGQVNYTFSDGYMIIAPSRALVLNAIRTKQNGNSLSRSGEFRSLLPRDQYADFSGVFYQNLAPVIQPIASQLNAQQLQALQQLAVDSKPTVICAYGEQNRIQVVSGSKLLPFNLNIMALSSLMGRENAGTSHKRHP